MMLLHWTMKAGNHIRNIRGKTQKSATINLETLIKLDEHLTLKSIDLHTFDSQYVCLINCLYLKTNVDLWYILSCLEV